MAHIENPKGVKRLKGLKTMLGSKVQIGLLGLTLIVAAAAPVQAQTTDEMDARVTAELDAFWAAMSRTVEAGDFDGYAALYHPDAVLVSLGSETSYPIAQALSGWEQLFIDTRTGAAEAHVSFRFTRRLHDATTAHETGIFRYVFQAEGEAESVAMLHFEGLLVKKDGAWKLMMEFQKQEATAGEWEAAGAG